MAKQKQIKTSIKNNETGETSSVVSAMFPRKTEVGIYYYLKLNQKAKEWFDNNGFNVNNTADLEKLWCKSTGMPEECVGSLGRYKTPEEKALWDIQVEIDGQVVDWAEQTSKYTKADETPAVKEPQTISMEQPKEETPTEPQQLQAEPKVLELKADKTQVEPELKAETVTNIQNYLKDGVSETDIRTALENKYGKELAEKYLSKAKDKPQISLKL